MMKMKVELGLQTQYFEGEETVSGATPPESDPSTD